MAIALLLLFLALMLFVLAGRLRTNSQLPEGEVVYSDTGAWKRNDQVLYSKKYRLSGKPDYLIRHKNSLVPVELKSGRAPAKPHAGHVLQLAAYCLLAEEALGKPVREGIIQYGDTQHVVAYDAELQDKLLATLQSMRADLTAGDDSRNHQEPRRCRSCGVREACDQRLDAG
jgi:CRISPR-associated exonuclease Cas4